MPDNKRLPAKTRLTRRAGSFRKAKRDRERQNLIEDEMRSERNADFNRRVREGLQRISTTPVSPRNVINTSPDPQRPGPFRADVRLEPNRVKDTRKKPVRKGNTSRLM